MPDSSCGRQRQPFAAGQHRRGLRTAAGDMAALLAYWLFLFWLYQPKIFLRV
jgi:hypothetical protein